MEIIIIQSCHIAYHYHSDPDPEVEAWNVLEPSRRRFRKNQQNVATTMKRTTTKKDKKKGASNINETEINYLN